MYAIKHVEYAVHKMPPKYLVNGWPIPFDDVVMVCIYAYIYTYVDIMYIGYVWRYSNHPFN